MLPATATHTVFARRTVPVAFEPRGGAQGACVRTLLFIEWIGHLVPRTAFVGRVHSVFAQACNLTVGDTLLTVSTFGTGNGPTVLRLVRDAATDLREQFEVGERIVARLGSLRTRRISLVLLHASVWHPAEPGRFLPAALIETRLREVRLRLRERRAAQPNVLDAAGAPLIAALASACRTLDLKPAVRHLDRLIGWGEGLTPAGDDFLVGLTAGLGALVGDDHGRHLFLSSLAAAVAARTQRTTPIAAHCLRLAAAGHYGEPLVELRNALLCAADDSAVEIALRRALAVGSSSGADTVSGLLAGLLAWLPAPSVALAR